jgi:hypothetical protein
MEKAVQQMRKKIDGVSDLFLLDACRHGGMTELEEAELTDGQGRALSGHKTAQAYRGYAKETMVRALAATRKRHAHLLAQKEFDQHNVHGAEPPRDGMQKSPAASRFAADRKAQRADGVSASRWVDDIRHSATDAKSEAATIESYPANARASARLVN